MYLSISRFQTSVSDNWKMKYEPIVIFGVGGEKGGISIVTSVTMERYRMKNVVYDAVDLSTKLKSLLGFPL
ncbi:predicted protein [Sclerotinia sclerotiorum 1980 UF-70]|uniref:Uncharacterized protein n=1 Tax=Sclerotinia sclerotiorum (strain ATCC 18683 / 1980 / Ss-1) TaxID=665079 RepID=A7E658_SCLS1|nr:predicted protein [Sclerotinia sclerotiorum 1980 UF-70]EDN91380.1 predicted protein [Sclerotinia sclerotiorum 1980 UF-70]